MPIEPAQLMLLKESTWTQGGGLSTASDAYRLKLYARFSNRITVNDELNRSLVSFQANRKAAMHRWFKYKEGFSAPLVDYLLERFRPKSVEPPQLLDPFAGSGTALERAVCSGWNACGIELLPVGCAIIRAREAARQVRLEDFRRLSESLTRFDWNAKAPKPRAFPHIKITEKAFPDETERHLAAFWSFAEGIHDQNLQRLFSFACLSVLEDISYTRKDGQYLRWDNRCGRELKSSFTKGVIQTLPEALLGRINQIAQDIEGLTPARGAMTLLEASCLDQLRHLSDGSFHLTITSPPYCNRYDYTRTYALELAALGRNDDQVRQLRQLLLSATVENRSKARWLEASYQESGDRKPYHRARKAFASQEALAETLGLLRRAAAAGDLNNPNIPAMVENYFLEMAVVIFEMSRLTAPGGHVVMVNDNVQYHGEEVPVDLILSDFAESAGMRVEAIWVLPRGKGNSSQQMGRHGRNEIRKCVYVWKKH